MEMVSAAKLKRYQNIMTKAMPFTQELEAMLSRLTEDQTQDQSGETAKEQFTHPFFIEREEKKSLLVVIASDTGLCGSYNSDIIEQARDYLVKSEPAPMLVGIGKFAIRALQRDGYDFQATYSDVKTDQIEETIKALTGRLQEAYLSGQVDAVYVIYSHFLSMTSFANTLEKILPLKKPEQSESGSQPSASYIYEPSPETIFEKLIPAFFEAKIRMIFLESYVSEHMARMNAMHQATKNAKEMIDSLVLVRNKLRQAIITKEIIEIVSGSRAQKH